MNRQQRRAAERARARAGAHTQRHATERAPIAPAQPLIDEQRWDEAERVARQSLAEDGSDVASRVALRTALWRLGRLDEAMLEARRVLRARPEDPAAHEAMGFILFSQDRVPESIVAFEKAVAQAPDRWSAHVGLGNGAAALGALDQALTHHRAAVELAPDASAAHNDLARTLFRMGDFAGAAAAYDRAAQGARGRPPLIEWNRSLALLGMGELADGWAAYDAGLTVGARTPNRSPGVPQWAGEDLTGSTLLVWGEQGLGDEVRFASCFGDVIERADHVIIETNPRLVPILARSFPDATVRAETFDRTQGRETLSFDGVDAHSPSGSLPRYVRPTLDSFPQQDGHLQADAGARERFRARLGALPPGLRVGICWRSMNLATDRLSHYTTLGEWEPILRVPGVTFVNLQYGDATLREVELDEAEGRTGTVVHRWADVDYTVDIDEVAGLTAELDVVIGPNTFSTILAGALGIPTLVIGLPAIWQHGQAREPWTPSALHVTRRWDQSWTPVMERAAGELRRRAAV